MKLADLIASQKQELAHSPYKIPFDSILNKYQTVFDMLMHNAQENEYLVGIVYNILHSHKNHMTQIAFFHNVYNKQVYEPVYTIVNILPLGRAKYYRDRRHPSKNFLDQLYTKNPELRNRQRYILCCNIDQDD